MMCSIGIDLGTTYSCVAFVEKGKVEAIANDQGNYTTPSCVAFAETKQIVGERAKKCQEKDPKSTIYDVKRLIGREFDDPSVQADMKNLLFEVEQNDGKPKIKVTFGEGPATLDPEEISSYVLEHMITVAKDFTGKEINSAVITVPAHFNDAQRRATKEAAALAKIFVQKTINEPTAAALAYGLEKGTKLKKNILIYDLGGGTFDVTILTVKDEHFEVKSTGGDTHLGGQDFNLRLYNHLVKEFAKETKLDMTKDLIARHRLLEECEAVKRLLSSKERTQAHVASLFGGKDLDATVTQARFEHLNEDLFKGTMETVNLVLKDANMFKQEIDEVVLVGGSTRIPFVQTLLEDYFGKEKICKSINPDEAVARGAAIHAAMLSNDVSTMLQNFRLDDVTSLSIGIEGAGFRMDQVIKRNTAIPTQVATTRVTVHENQEAMTYKIFEGERSLTKHNHLLGSFTLSNIPKLPAGEAKSQVMFDLDANGVLHLTARDSSNVRNESSIKLTWENKRRSKADIEEMIKKAEKYRVVDDLVKRTLTVRAELDIFANRAKRVAQQSQGTIAQRKKLLNMSEGVLAWIKSNPNAQIFQLKHKRKELDEAFQPFQ